MNKICIFGRLTKDPVKQTTSNGVEYCRFNVAVKSNKQDPDTNEYKTDFFSCITWRKSAESLCKYRKKGDFVTIEGSMTSYSFDKDGERRINWQLEANNIYFNFTGGESDTEQEKSANAKTTKPKMTPMADQDDEDLPF